MPDSARVGQSERSPVLVRAGGKAMVETLTLEQASRIVREAIRDKTYLETPLGRDVQAYMRVKRKRLSPGSEIQWEGILHKLAIHFPDLRVEDFEPPAGTEMLEQFMDGQWGHLSGSYYNRNHSILKDFFKFWRQRERLKGDPMLFIELARTDQPHRTTFNEDEVRAILGSQAKLRDRIAVRIMLHYGLRQGSMRKIQFKHFDYPRRRLTVFSKGGKVRDLGIPEPQFWTDLERYVLEAGVKDDDYLMCSAKGNRRYRVELLEKPMSNATFHYWWYKRLEEAGVVDEGTTTGRKPHSARHTAGQRVLDKTGNLKLAQKLLGHANIATTGNIYADYDENQLFVAMAQILGQDDSETS